MAFLTCEHLSIGYEDREVLKDVSFVVNPGDYVSILGENGAGKSTLMKTVLHLIKPLSGEIELGDGLRADEIGYLPQQTFVQKDFPASVWEIVLSGCQARKGFHPFYTAADKKAAETNLKKMHMSEYKDSCYRELSGGQQQRVLLARALCATEKLLVLDEPVSGLDPLTTKQLYKLIAELNASGVTIIMISHDLAASLEYSSHILYIGDGIFFGTTEEFEDSEKGKRFIGRKGEKKDANLK
ncbi:MAG: ABC transporter ATP-binding protein [Lachnospiraceae bacterium]|nr:ABC transporter ATP-binding protein [Lachnospiraceae bacterium]